MTQIKKEVGDDSRERAFFAECGGFFRSLAVEMTSRV